jgi:hypothetical protein
LTVPVSKPSLKKLPPLEEELELLLEEELDDEELEELELEELLLDDEELEELLLEDELLELDEELELLEDEELELPEPTQVGPVKLPSCVPWKPNTLEAVAPGAGSCQLQQLVN